MKRVIAIGVVAFIIGCGQSEPDGICPQVGPQTPEEGPRQTAKTPKEPEVDVFRMKESLRSQVEPIIRRAIEFPCTEESFEGSPPMPTRVLESQAVTLDDGCRVIYTVTDNGQYYTHTGSLSCAGKDWEYKAVRLMAIMGVGLDIEKENRTGADASSIRLSETASGTHVAQFDMRGH